MESTNILDCPSCNQKFTEVYMFPCMHSFCCTCTDLMKKGPETKCSMCFSSCREDDIRKNTFLEKICLIEAQNKKSKIGKVTCELCDSDGLVNEADKYCLDCFQYICSKCSKIHVNSKMCKNHKIVDKNTVDDSTFNSPEPKCEKHGKSLSIYCMKCDLIICQICCSMNHFDHDKSDSLKEIFEQSNGDIKKTIGDIDDIIQKQCGLISENKRLEADCLQNCDEITKELEAYAKELKDRIDDLTKANVNKVNEIKKDYILSIQENGKDTTNYVTSLTNIKSYFEKVIKNGSNFDVFNLKNQLKQKNWINTKKPSVIKRIKLYFKKPVNKSLSSELLESVKFDTIIDLKKYKLRKSISSACVYKQSIYTVNKADECIEIYDIDTAIYQSSIDLMKYTQNKTILQPFCVFNTQDYVFVFYCYHATTKAGFIKITRYTHILKLDDATKTLLEVKTINDECRIASCFQPEFTFAKRVCNNLLIKTIDNTLIESASDGSELRRFKIPNVHNNKNVHDFSFPDTNTYSYPFQLNNFNSTNVHQLFDGRYVATSYADNSAFVSLLNSAGILINTFTLESSDICTCTDGVKYVFVLERRAGKVIVITTDLRYLHQLEFDNVNAISYDRENEKVLLAMKTNEIIHFKYSFGNLF